MKRIYAAALFIISSGLYILGASPSIYGGDSGELIASAVTLGVSHAPGYPLHALLGRAFSEAIPWAGAAYRVNILSSVLSGLTVAGIFLFVSRRLMNPWFGLIAAAAYSSFPIVWDQAQTAEVFALNNFFAATLLILWPVLFSDKKRRSLNAWAFVFGLALANHQTIVLLVPGFLASTCRAAWDRSVTFAANLRAAARTFAPNIPPMGLFLLFGMSIYLYLPFRAAKHPPVNFGDPHTPRRFADVLTRKEFGSLELHPTALPRRTLKSVGEQVNAFLRQSVNLSGGIVFCSGLLGFLFKGRRHSGETRNPAQEFSQNKDDPSLDPGFRRNDGRPLNAMPGFFFFWFFSGPFFYIFSNLSPFNTLALWRLERFLLLPSIFIALGAAVFLRLLWSKGLRIAVWVLIAGMAAETVLARELPYFRWNLAFRDFGRNLAASLAPRSLLVIDRVLFDEPTSCLLNRRLVERQRDDLRVIYRPGTLFELFYGEDILEIPRAERFERQSIREGELWKSLDRPLSTLAFSKENLPPFPMRLKGLVYQREPGPDPSAVYLHRERQEGPARDYPTRLITVHYPYFAAKQGFERKDLGFAGAQTARAAVIGRDMEWLRSNLGSLWSQWGAESSKPISAAAIERARTEFEAAIRIDPYFAQGYFGLGYVSVKEGKNAQAVGLFSRAVSVKPDWAEAYYMLGVAYSLAGEQTNARNAWMSFLRLDPGSPLAAEVRRALASSPL